MFERYTEKARRVVFFARYEASQFGSTQIEAEHVLLGLIREDKNLTYRFFHRSHATVESIRREIEGRTVLRDRIPNNIDLPLSVEAKHVLAYAAEESERLGNRHIGTEHLLLGLLREENSLAAEILYERGLRLSEPFPQPRVVLLIHLPSHGDDVGEDRAFDEETREHWGLAPRAIA